MDRVVATCRRAHAWRSSHQFLGRYSVDKLQQFDQYLLQTSVARSIRVIALTVAVPFVVLVAVLSIATSDHDDEIAVSVQSVIGHAVVGVAMGLSSRQALGIPVTESPLLLSFVVGAFVGIGSELFRLLLVEIWQMTPVPMGEVFVGIAMTGIFFSSSYAFMRKSLRRRWTKVRTYAVVFFIQGSVISVFVLVALAFQSATYAGQLLLILLHPMLRVVAAKMVWLHARKLNDLTTDVTICFVEMTASLSQTACLQRVRSPELGTLLVMMDLTLASLDMYVYATREYVVDGVSTLHTSAKIIEGALDALSGSDAAEEKVRETKEGPTSIVPARRQSYVVHATPSSDAFVRSLSLTSNLPRSISNEFDSGLLFRKSEVVALAKAPDVLVPPTEGPELAKLRRTSSDLHGVDATRGTDLIKMAVTRGDKIERMELAPLERRDAWKNASATPSRRRRIGGSISSIAVSSSTITISTKNFSVVGADMSSPQHSAALDPNSETPENKTEAVTAARPSRNQRRSSTHAAIYSAPSVVATAMPTPTAASATSPGESVSNRSRRRASSVFLTPRLFHDHGSKRLMNLSAAPTLNNLPKPAGQAVRPVQSQPRPSQVNIDGLAITRKDQARILEQTLQLMFSFEALIVVQFIHVLVPVIIGIVLHVLWFLPSHRANVLLRDQSYMQVVTMASAAVAFGALEAIPLAALCYTTRKRYGLKSTRLLSFVLEHYWMSFHGKLVGAFVVAFFFLSHHYGVASVVSGET